MARLRPWTAMSSSSSTHGSWMGSLKTRDSGPGPAGIVTDRLPPTLTGTRVPGTTFAEYSWRPTVTLWKVTGALPKTFENRIRIVFPHRSGLTMERNVWLTAAAPVVVALGNGKARSGWMFATAYWIGFPTLREKGFWGGAG